MAKVLLITDNTDTKSVIQTTLLEDDIVVSSDEIIILDTMKVEVPDIVLFDMDSSFDIKNIYRKINDFPCVKLIIVGEKTVPNDILSDAHLFVSSPINTSLLKPVIGTGLKTKKSLIKLSKSNQELANSLYQLNVLYNTSSQLAGNLSRNKLIDIMNEGIDKSLNANISCTLSFNDEKAPVLVINSNYRLSKRLIEALKLRAVLNYKNSGIDISDVFALEDVKVERNFKDNVNEYDFEILNYNKLLSYITIDDRCYGYSEIFREKEFTQEDSKFFKTLVNQVTQPLKSAILYQEIAFKNRELARLEKLKSEFISIVSHELKTPLTSIKNSLDILSGGKAGDITDSMSKFFNMAKRNVKKLTRIINDLLDMSKIEAGKMDYSFAAGSILPVINDVTQSLAQTALKKNLKLCIRTEENIKDINADMGRIEQVLSNLVSNAIKFSPEKGTIKISAKMVEADEINVPECFENEIARLSGEYVQVSVCDEGIGIAQDDFAHVFDKFKQIENSLSREVGGSGLGLAIAKQLIAAHNGAIWCESTQNKGSSFHFVIPVNAKE